MARQVEALQVWAGRVVYELEHLNAADDVYFLWAAWLYGVVDDEPEYRRETLRWGTSFLKVEGGIVGKYVANECVKIMGG